MQGEILRIIPSGDFVTYIVKVSEKSPKTGRTYTGKSFRNYAFWKDFKVGDRISGIGWKNETRGIIDADSLVHLMP